MLPSLVDNATKIKIDLIKTLLVLLCPLDDLKPSRLPIGRLGFHLQLIPPKRFVGSYRIDEANMISDFIQFENEALTRHGRIG